MLRRGSPKGRYFVVTFDDAYSNIAAVEPFLSVRSIRPTVFVNGAFCEGTPYFRVLAAVLRDSGDACAQCRTAVGSSGCEVVKGSESAVRSDEGHVASPAQRKRRSVLPDARALGDPRLLRCHLDVEGLRTLETRAGRSETHTWEHRTLSALGPAEVESAIDRNVDYLRASRLRPINWLSYPNGLAAHVNQAVKTWLDRNVETHGMFAGGRDESDICTPHSGRRTSMRRRRLEGFKAVFLVRMSTRACKQSGLR